MSHPAFSQGLLHVAVITGQHVFDVPGFQALWRSLPGIKAYIQDLDNWAADEGRVRAAYDALVFYNYHRQGPEGRVRAALEALGETPQGVVLLHHAILAYPNWPLWAKLTGIAERSFKYYHGERLNIHVADADHPITQGLTDWQMVDETYLMADASADSRVLLTTDHERSMHTIAWTRQYGQARVLCLESGHDNETYVDASFRAVLARGVRWAAGQA
ncbi:MAG: ThuA domain-containing protein [Chloroflexota bacterium]